MATGGKDTAGAGWSGVGTALGLMGPPQQGDREGGPPGHYGLFCHHHHHPLVTLLPSPPPLPSLSPALSAFQPLSPLRWLPRPTLSSCLPVWCTLGCWRARLNLPSPWLRAEGRACTHLVWGSGRRHPALGAHFVSGWPHDSPSLVSESVPISVSVSHLCSVRVPSPVSPCGPGQGGPVPPPASGDCLPETVGPSSQTTTQFRLLV